MAKDALNVDKLNIGVGGKNKVTIRDGYYLDNGIRVKQSMYFKAGDTLHMEVKRHTDCYKEGVIGHKTTVGYQKNTVIGENHELIGVLKGAKQVLEERGINYSKAPGEATCKQVKMRNSANAERKRLFNEWDADRENQVKRLMFLTYPKQEDVVHQSKAVQCSCVSCVLSKQEDFKSQKNGLEEIYDKHNADHGTKHQCKFLPKFHPELNPIERVWSRLKWYLRKYADGKLETLQRLMKKGLERDNVSLTLIRKYCRLVTSYYYAYLDGKDIIQAESWIKKHRSHREHSDLMDERLYKLYYPNGIQDNIEELAQDNLVLDNTMVEYINDNHTCDNELDEWLQMIDDYQRTGRIV